MLRANQDIAVHDASGGAPPAGESSLALDRAPLQAEVQASLDRIVDWMHAEFPPAKTTVTEADDKGTASYLFRVAQGAPSPTLLISQDVFHHHDADEIIAALERSHVAARLRCDPITRLRCVAQDGRVQVVQRPSWRRRPPRGLPAFVGPLPPDPLQVAAEIVAALPDAVVVTGLDRKVLMANPAAAELFGRRQENLPGLAIDELVMPAQRQEVAARESRALEGEEQRYETTVARADGKGREVAVVATRLVLDGQLVGAVATLRDITAEKRALQIISRLGLPPRAHDRVLRIAGTIADLDGATDHSIPSSSQMSPPRGAARSNNTQRPSGDHTE